MLKKTWDKPEIMTILTKETEGGPFAPTKLDDTFPTGTPFNELTFS